MFKVLICDDHPICQVGLEYSLRHIFSEDLEIQKAFSGSELLDRFQQMNPDLVFLDLGLPDRLGIHLIQDLRERSSELPIIVVTACEDVNLLTQVCRLKPSALLSKAHAIETLHRALQAARWKGPHWPYLDPDIERRLEKSDRGPLTPREWEVLRLIAEGKTNRDIAELLRCSAETIKTHRARLGTKVQARNRAELTAWYLQRKSHGETGLPPGN